MAYVEVFYVKNTRDSKFTCRKLDDVNPIPTYEDLRDEYGKVFVGAFAAGMQHPESVYKALNIDPRQYIKYPLPEGVHHTSMSEGDVVKIDERYFICEPVGFTEFSVEQPKSIEALSDFLVDALPLKVFTLDKVKNIISFTHNGRAFEIRDITKKS